MEGLPRLLGFELKGLIEFLHGKREAPVFGIRVSQGCAANEQTVRRAIPLLDPIRTYLTPNEATLLRGHIGERSGLDHRPDGIRQPLHEK